MARQFKTKEPINDLLLAIYLLRRNWQDSTHRYFVTKDQGRPIPFAEIHIEHWNGGYGKCEYNGSWNYQVAPEIATQLINEKWVRLLPKGGGEPFHVYGDAYTLAERPRYDDRYEQILAEREAKAKKHFVAGTHSKFSSVLHSRGSDWELSWETDNARLWKYRLYFDFETPMNERARIYPDTGEVLLL